MFIAVACVQHSKTNTKRRGGVEPSHNQHIKKFKPNENRTELNSIEICSNHVEPSIQTAMPIKLIASSKSVQTSKPNSSLCIRDAEDAAVIAGAKALQPNTKKSSSHRVPVVDQHSTIGEKRPTADLRSSPMSLETDVGISRGIFMSEFNRFRCLNCQGAFDSIESLSTHYETRHANSVNLFEVFHHVNCFHCGKNFKAHEMVDHHLLKHNDTFLAIVSTNNSLKCGQCGYIATPPKKLVDHLQNCHPRGLETFKPIYLTDKLIAEVTAIDCTTPRTCDICGIYCLSEVEHNRHHQLKHKLMLKNFTLTVSPISYRLLQMQHLLCNYSIRK